MFPSAYLAAFPRALASETISLPSGMRLTPTPLLFSSGEPKGRYTVPDRHVALSLGGHCSPGYLRDAAWIIVRDVEPERIDDPLLFTMPVWAKPILHVGLLSLTTIQT